MDILRMGVIQRLKNSSSFSNFEQQYKLLLDHLPVPWFVCDDNGLILDANRFTLDLIKYPIEDFKRNSIFKLLQLDTDIKDTEYIDTLKKGQIVALQSDFLTKTEQIKNAEVTIIPVIKKKVLNGMVAILFDNTNERQLKASLDQLKENVIHGQALLNIGSWTYHLQKDNFFASEEFYHIFDSNANEFDGSFKGYYSYVHPDDREWVKIAVQEAIAGKEYDIEYRIITPNGIEKIIHEKARVLVDEENNPVKMIGTIQDITKQKIIENERK